MIDVAKAKHCDGRWDRIYIVKGMVKMNLIKKAYGSMSWDKGASLYVKILPFKEICRIVECEIPLII